MNQDVLLSNVTANSTVVSWAQAYSTLNFYVVLSLWKPMTPEQEEGTSIIPLGKDLLDRLQREFFSFDEKTLDNTKQAVINALAEIEGKSIHCSIALATIKKDTLFIVLSSGSKTILRRNGRFGIIAEGEENEVIGFSGEIQPRDLIILATEDFVKKIPPKNLIDFIDNRPVHELSEIIAPVLHTDAKGSEGAMFIQYKPEIPTGNEEPEETSEESIAPVDYDELPEEHEAVESEMPTRTEQKVQDEVEKKTEEDFEPKIHTYTEHEEKSSKFPVGAIFRKIPISKKSFQNRKVIGSIVLILLIILLASIGAEWNKRRVESARLELEKITVPAEKRLDEARTLQDLDVTLALEELTRAKEELRKSIGLYKEGSEGHTKISGLLSQIDSMIQEIEKGSEISNAKELLKSTGDLGNIQATGEFEEKIAGLFENGFAEIEGSNAKREAETKDSFFAFAHDGRFYYAANNEKIVRIDKGNGNDTNVDTDKRSTIAIDTFGGNIYALQKDGVIVRFASTSFSDSNYLKEEVNRPIEPSSFTIDGSIYVIQNNGEIKKYTRGTLDPFGVKGVVTPIGSGALIDTAEGFSNLYVLDRKNKRIIILEKNGNFKTQLQWNSLADASSFAVDEKSQKAYIIIQSTLFEIPLASE